MKPGGHPSLDAETTTIARRAAAANVNLYVLYMNVHFLRYFSPEYGKRNTSLFEDITLFGSGLEKFADSAGGSFFQVEVDSDPFVDRALRETSALYVLGVEVLSGDRDGRDHFIRVAVKDKAAAVRYRRVAAIPRSASTTGASAAAKEPGHAAPSSPAGGEGRALPTGRGATFDTAPGQALKQSQQASQASGTTELEMLFARLVDYVANYRQDYSAVVAEEDYRQSTPTERVHLRSDFLLVKSPDIEGWVSYRDVFEVDGYPVRDREERVRKLFLDPTPVARERLRQIKEESARYNVGEVQRNLNVPLFPLLFLDPANVQRFRFELGGKRQLQGIETRQVEFKERTRPTIVRNDYDDSDMPASGWFLVDPATGAVLQTALFYYGASDQSCETVVQYVRDPALAMWVPAEMSETCRDRNGSFMLKREARYSNFRRFQVTTEERITIPK